jgi:N-acetylmuramoyl-L-alanine amidase
VVLPACDHGRVVVTGVLQWAVWAAMATTVLVTPVSPAQASAGDVRETPGIRAARATPRPPEIVQRRISFPDSRKQQMADYSKRHYGRAVWRLHPRGIVEHYTGSDSLASVLATFATNDPDPELGERPGVCAHFVIDKDGTIYQLVSTRIRCRHTVGLNHRMIGVEHVGTSDAAVLGNGRQLRASLRLTAWLVHRFTLSTGDVIGHSESVSSRFHRERYPPWRCQTHRDFSPPAMRRYRTLLVRGVARWTADTSAPDWRQRVGRCPSG